MHPHGHNEDHQQAGFTLVEVLVTLALLSLLAVIVFGSLAQVLGARARLRPYLDRSEETVLVASWFRQTVQALIADYDTGKNRFTATANGFSGLTASPLIGPPGTPTSFSWVLKYDPGLDVTFLEYGEKPSNTMQIARWSGKGAAFSYYGQDQESRLAAARFGCLGSTRATSSAGPIGWTSWRAFSDDRRCAAGISSAAAPTAEPARRRAVAKLAAIVRAAGRPRVGY
jgi:prepilin-type N-terminal cleavage/methylation domain-containing protein